MRHYELYSWSHHYRQERMAEARRLHLEGKLGESRNEREQHNPISALRNVLALLRSSSKPNDGVAGEPVR